jgi:hypothetical protein
MYLDETLIDSVDISTIVHPQVQGQLIREGMHRLLQKHKQNLESCDLTPQFYLEGVPSQVNSFQSMKDRYMI